jgi:hypothetical protein
VRSRHTFQSGKSDGGDTSLVRPSDWNADHLPALTLDTRTANYTITSADGGELLRAAHSASITFTLPAASGLAAGWCIWVENRQTGTGAASALSITRAGTDTIDGVATIYTYPGDLRVIFRTGTGTFESVLIRGGLVTVTNTAGETIYWPSSTLNVDLTVWGAGGGGGGGSLQASGTASDGGNGGGGGACLSFPFPGATYAASTAMTVTPGVGGAGGAARSTNGSGNDGGVGGTTTVVIGGVTVLRGFGGGGGQGGGGPLGCGGGGGGSHGAGVTGAYNNPGDGGMGPGGMNAGTGSLAGSVYAGMQGGGGNGVNINYPTAFGGGGGAAASSGANGKDAASSLFGGSGGGAGGSITASNTSWLGNDSGKTGFHNGFENAGIAAAGPVNSTTNGTAGSSTPSALGPTEGGGGGSPHNAGNSGAGGAGGVACGGGGGGGCQGAFTAGAGGAGGAGLFRMSYR